MKGLLSMLQGSQYPGQQPGLLNNPLLHLGLGLMSAGEKNQGIGTGLMQGFQSLQGMNQNNMIQQLQRAKLQEYYDECYRGSDVGQSVVLLRLSVHPERIEVLIHEIPDVLKVHDFYVT